LEQRFETARIEAFGRDAQDVARCPGREKLVVGPVGEQASELRHVAVQDGVHRRRGVVAPELLDEPLARDDLVRVQDKKGEQRALLRAAERQRALRLCGLERPEDLEVETR
jgi:hypothetical protein